MYFNPGLLVVEPVHEILVLIAWASSEGTNVQYKCADLPEPLFLAHKLWVKMKSLTKKLTSTSPLDI